MILNEVTKNVKLDNSRNFIREVDKLAKKI